MTEGLYFPALGIKFNLNRVAFSIGEMNIYWYGIIIAVGVILAVAYAMKKARKVGVHPDRFVDVLIGGIIGGIIGARLYFVLLEWETYKTNLSEIFKIWHGGLAIYGGIIGAVLAGYIMCKIRKVKFLPMLDLAAVGFLIGQSIGRWGNFVNIEAFGSNTTLPWGMTSEKIMNYLASHAEELQAQGVNVVVNMPVHPCFLYESLWCLIGFVALHFYFKHRRFDGEVFLLYTAWYGLGRFFIEGLRTDSLVIGTIRISQVVAALFCLASVIAIIVIRYKIAKEHDENYLKPYGDTPECAEMLARLDEQLKSKKSKKAAAEEENTKKAEDFKLTEEEKPEAEKQADEETAAAENELPDEKE